MRTIKFRAWDGREFIKDRYNRNHFISIADGKLVQVQHDDVCDEGFVYGNPKPVILQQFTGLTDINGVDIYEGDILSAPFANGEYAKNIKRKFFNVSVKITPERGASVELPSNVFTGSYRWRPHFSECEVIGNIYQNQELLK